MWQSNTYISVMLLLRCCWVAAAMAAAAKAHARAAAGVAVWFLFAPLTSRSSHLLLPVHASPSKVTFPESGLCPRWAHWALLQVRVSSGMTLGDWAKSCWDGRKSQHRQTQHSGLLRISETHNTITVNKLRPNTYMLIGLLIKVYWANYCIEHGSYIPLWYGAKMVFVGIRETLKDTLRGIIMVTLTRSEMDEWYWSSMDIMSETEKVMFKWDQYGFAVWPPSGFANSEAY